MSHFTVLVPAKDQEELEKVLLPYHEYESTGIKEYTEFVPEDMEDLREKFKEYGGDLTFDEFIPGWNGAEKNSEGVWGRITNPNRKWDWWSIGGRWSGTLMLKSEAYGKGENGVQGLFVEVNTDPKLADSALSGEIDWQAMRREQMRKSAARYTAWKNLPDKNSVDEKVYAQALRDSGFFMVERGETDDLNTMTGVQYTAKYGREKAMTFAFIDLEGKWNERAHMGWFAVTWDENPEYDSVWWQFIRSLPADQRVYVVDCHI